MRSFISEDDIEKAILERFSKQDFGYGILKCDLDPGRNEDLNDGTDRSSK